jgi:hypothetical protein
MTTADPSRSSDGSESLWAYTHLPRGYTVRNRGTSQLHQQLVFRPVPGLGRPELPIENLYLAGASAHPGGGVHGASGWNAARACLANHGLFGGLRRRSVSAVLDRLYRDRRSAS